MTPSSAPQRRRVSDRSRRAPARFGHEPLNSAAATALSSEDSDGGENNSDTDNTSDYSPEEGRVERRSGDDDSDVPSEPGGGDGSTSDSSLNEKLGSVDNLAVPSNRDVYVDIIKLSELEPEW